MSELNMDEIRFIDPADVQAGEFSEHYVGCVVLTKDKRILLQQRGEDWSHYPGYVCEFGGHIEAGETPLAAIIRELGEELGADVHADDIISLGAVAERSSNFTELVYVYFWHDKLGTITGCYEGEALFADNVEQALQAPKMMASVRWLLQECARRGYF